MKKRLLSTLLALCMVLALLPVPALAADDYSGTCGDNLTWTLDSNGTLTIRGAGPMKEFSMDDTNPSPWKGRDAIKTVIIEDGVTSIEESAFLHCGYLTSVTIPSSVTSIGGHAFSGCAALTSVIIPDGVVSIGHQAFNCCSGLRKLVIPKSVEQLGGCLFDSCTNLVTAGPIGGDYITPE